MCDVKLNFMVNLVVKKWYGLKKLYEKNIQVNSPIFDRPLCWTSNARKSSVVTSDFC